MGKRILIAEDSSVILNLTKKILEQEQYQITAAKNGQEVIQMVEQDDFDLILMDINMPVMDGMACSRQIRSMQNQAKANVPIFAITGNANNYTTEEFKAAGINEYLQKPLNFDQLVTLVHNYTS